MAQTKALEPISQFKLSNQIFDTNLFEKVKLTASAKLVLIVLCRYYPKIYPCQKTIAKKSGLSVRSVINGLSELKQKGLLLVECNYSNTYKFTNLFFEFAEVSHSTGKFCTQQDEKFAQNKTKNKNINTSDFKQIKSKHVHMSIEGVKYPDPYQTIQAYKKDRQTASSPLDFSREKQIEYYNNLPDFAKKGLFASEIKRRWKLK